MQNNDVQKFMCACDWLILPSRAEVFPIVLLEALANGLPILATDVGCTSNIVNSNNGILVQSTPEHLSNGILRAFNVCNKAIKAITLPNKYSLVNFAIRMEDIYKLI